MSQQLICGLLVSSRTFCKYKMKYFGSAGPSRGGWSPRVECCRHREGKCFEPRPFLLDHALRCTGKTLLSTHR